MQERENGGKTANISAIFTLLACKNFFRKKSLHYYEFSGRDPETFPSKSTRKTKGKNWIKLEAKRAPKPGENGRKKSGRLTKPVSWEIAFTGGLSEDIMGLMISKIAFFANSAWPHAREEAWEFADILL
ncbi:MAG: hypothetical protein Q4C76_08710 [Bacillota bacterium]|nr:hypothetical protein [Bacillota bacterium]